MAAGQASAIPAAVLGYITAKYGSSQQLQMRTDPVWSTLRFAGTVAANTLTIPVGTVSAFGYGLNGDMASAGRQGTVATQADTNLQVAGQTRDQADVFIYGASAYVSDGEPAMAQRIWREVDVAMSTNGSVVTPIGTLDMFPHPGGLFGESNSALLQPNFSDAGGGVDSGQGALKKFFTNGFPSSGSYKRFDVPIFWAGLGSGPDSTLSIQCTVRRAISIPVPVARTAAAGIAAYTQFATAQAFVDVRWTLFAVTVQRRSVNAA